MTMLTTDGLYREALGDALFDSFYTHRNDDSDFHCDKLHCEHYSIPVNNCMCLDYDEWHWVCPIAAYLNRIIKADVTAKAMIADVLDNHKD